MKLLSEIKYKLLGSAIFQKAFRSADIEFFSLPEGDTISKYELFDLIGRLPLSFLIVDASGLIRFANHSAKLLTGYSSFKGITINTLFPVVKDREKMITTEISGQLNTFILNKNNKLFCVWCSFKPISFRNEKFQLIQVIDSSEVTNTNKRPSEQEITDDISNSNSDTEKDTGNEFSQRIHAIKSQLSIEPQLNAIFNNLLYPVFLLNKKLEVLLYNNSAKEFFEISDTKESRIRFGDVITCEGSRNYLEKCGYSEKCKTCGLNRLFNKNIIPGTEIKNEEVVFNHSLNPSANPIKALATIKIISIENESYTLVTFDDITARKEYEKELREAKEHAEESDRLKTIFLNNLSHELRTPLNGILGFSELLVNSENPKDIRQFAEIINKSGKRLLFVIEDLFTVSSILSKSVHIQPRNIKLAELINDTKVMLQEEQLISENNNVSLNFNIPASVNGQVVNVDPSIFMIIVKKLAKNAFKFTCEGSVEFGLELKDNQEPVFFVKDTGIGIEPKTIEKIFHLFRQGNEDSTRMYGGTGSGLSISKGLVELLDGKIWIDSTPGKGSTFYFQIPVNPAKSSLEQLHLKSTLSNYNLNGKTILIVEDNDYNFFLLDAYFEDTGANIIHTPSGKEAVKIVMSNPLLDLVLMDLRLPDISGFSATKLIKQYNPKLPVIAQSALTTSEDIEHAFESGCDDYIKKPVSVEQLFEKILKVISN